ncbi:hypothetical protein BO70DRAFT_21674 [Aspergillus heteromorphus CBS 117.55]|uniref:Uncharacterized protein n=1 Tax=Aspergillus heteromorphus CBS 117.55 TaxID=1448321 RepID=A0A317X2Q1_9EURO|nr:uncharacterized protein BO70DRAFT_21674 [Aspergillus heteromorphus CBS 117.55]PWY92914.1 hypothetical protein BO70DRAFT_21674 [Aspergillus heteromorphus CBS 117.55]
MRWSLHLPRMPQRSSAVPFYDVNWAGLISCPSLTPPLSSIVLHVIGLCFTSNLPVHTNALGRCGRGFSSNHSPDISKRRQAAGPWPSGHVELALLYVAGYYIYLGLVVRTQRIESDEHC